MGHDVNWQGFQGQRTANLKTYTSFAVRMRPRQLRWHAPVVKYLIELEMDGITVYDVYLKQEVLAVAPACTVQAG